MYKFTRKRVKVYKIPSFLQQTMVLASGGQDGAICLWDVLTGSRVSHVYGHRGDVTSLVCTTSCIISSGLDDLICIWDRSTGIKLYSIQQVRPRKALLTERNVADRVSCGSWTKRCFLTSHVTGVSSLVWLCTVEFKQEGAPAVLEAPVSPAVPHSTQLHTVHTSIHVYTVTE